MKKQPHTPVLEEQVLEVLHPKLGESFLDMTAGFGGHSARLLERIGSEGYGYLIDQDESAITSLKYRFEHDKNVTIIRDNFASEELLDKLPKVDMILLDLGVSSVQLDETERGFSFNKEARLDMRMDQRQKKSAYEIVNEMSEKELADIIYQNGEERRSRAIAAAIVQARRVSPIVTTTQLAEIVAKHTPRQGKIHPATRTFAALRIEVNDELRSLDKVLTRLVDKINPGGRIAIISFHSLEDRRVKQFFQMLIKDKLDLFGQIETKAQFFPVTKKAIAGKLFDRNNPRARSAMLRAVEHIK